MTLPLGRRFVFLAILGFLALAGLAPSRAQEPPPDYSSKLSPRVRMAVQALASAKDGARQVAGAVTATGELDVFIVGDVSRQELEAAGARVRTALPGVYTAFLPVNAVAAVAGKATVARIEAAVETEANLDASVPAMGVSSQRGPAPFFPGANGQGVVVGIVDTGVDWSHDDFKDALGHTRILRYWDQSDPLGPFPGGFGYGSEWFPPDLDGGLSRAHDTDGHGTHVAGISAGDGSASGPGSAPPYTYVGVAPLADIIAVKSDFTTTGIVDAVSYVFNQAALAGKNAVVSMALATQYGPHDGTSAFEQGLSQLTGPGRIVCVVAGNQRNRAIHAEVNATSTVNATIQAGGSTTGAAFGVDGYYESTENLALTVITPGGTNIGPLFRGSLNASYPGQPTVNGTVYVENGASVTATGDFEVYLEVSVGPGQNLNGTWTFQFQPVVIGPAQGEVDLWQYFTSATTVSANFVLGNQPSQEMIIEPGNAQNVITVGAWTSKRYWTDCGGNTNVQFNGANDPGNLAPFSSPGPTRDNRTKPEISAPGSAIGSTRSSQVSAACSGPGFPSALLPGLLHTMKAGTSMASAHVTGLVALLLQAEGSLTPADVVNYLAAHAGVDAYTGTVPNMDWGSGKAQLADTTPPTVTLGSPIGGESWTVGTIQSVLWSATDGYGTVSSIDLQLSRTGPVGPFEDIALALPNTGNYLWTVSGPVTPNAILRVTAHDGAGNFSAAESGSFQITPPGSGPPAVIVQTPLGGESVVVGSTLPITWSAVPGGAPITGIDIELSRNGSGGLYVPVASGLPNSGVFHWPVIGPPTVNAWIRVTAHDASFFSGGDVSDGAIVIRDAPPVSGCYPPGGADDFSTTAQVTVNLPGLGLHTTIDLAGPTVVSRSAPVDQGGGIYRIDTVIEQLELTGLSCLGPVTVRLNPSLPSVGQILESSPGVCYPAASTFQVFPVILVPGLTLHTQQPVALSATIHSIPPYGDAYTGLVPVTLYDSFNVPMGTIEQEVHTPQTPYDCMLSTAVVDVEILSFPQETINLQGPVLVRRDAPVFNALSGLWDTPTEMLGLDLRGTSANLGPVVVALNPDTPTLGVISQPGYGMFPAQSYFNVSFMITPTSNPDVVVHTSTPSLMRAVISGVPPIGDDYENDTTVPLEDWKTRTPVGRTTRHIHTPTQVVPWAPYPEPGTVAYCGTLDLTFSPNGGPSITVPGMDATWVIDNSAAGTRSDGLSTFATRTQRFEASGYSTVLGESVYVFTKPLGATEDPPPGQGPNVGAVVNQSRGPTYPATSTQDLYLIIYRPTGNPRFLENNSAFTVGATLNAMPFDAPHTGSNPKPLYNQLGVPTGSLDAMTISTPFPYKPDCQVAPDCGANVVGVIGEVYGPIGLRLRPSVPNPFSKSAAILFDLPKETSVEIMIFDIMGRRLRRLDGGVLPTGPHALSWDGRDDTGADVPSGIYLYRVVTKLGKASGRMVLVR